MLQPLKKVRHTHLKWKNNEDYNKRDGGVWNAWCTHVCVKDAYGDCTKYSFVGGFHDSIYYSISKKSIVSNLYIYSYTGNI